MTSNTELRLKFSKNPEKFMQSEILLDEQIKALASVAASPHLYPVLVKLGTISSLLQLLAHENVDLTVDVVSLVRYTFVISSCRGCFLFLLFLLFFNTLFFSSSSSASTDQRACGLGSYRE